MKDFLSWLHHHPIKACGFTAWFTFAACALAYEQVALWLGSCMGFGGLFWWIVIYMQDTSNDWREE